MPAARTQARHHKQALIMRRADFGRAIQGNQRVAARDDVASTPRLHKRKARGGGRDCLGHLGEALRLTRRRWKICRREMMWAPRLFPRAAVPGRRLLLLVLLRLRVV